MNKFEHLTNEIENILSNLPDSLKLGWQFYDDSVEFKITVKPIGFTKENEQLLISRLNKVALSFHKQQSSKRLENE